MKQRYMYLDNNKIKDRITKSNTKQTRINETYTSGQSQWQHPFRHASIWVKRKQKKRVACLQQKLSSTVENVT